MASCAQLDGSYLFKNNWMWGEGCPEIPNWQNICKECFDIKILEEGD
jgi:hypothetical protein